MKLNRRYKHTVVYESENPEPIIYKTVSLVNINQVLYIDTDDLDITSEEIQPEAQ